MTVVVILFCKVIGIYSIVRADEHFPFAEFVDYIIKILRKLTPFSIIRKKKLTISKKRSKLRGVNKILRLTISQRKWGIP